MKKTIFAILAAGTFFASCEKDVKEKIFLGPATTFQHGKAWTWYETDNAEKPLRLGIAIDKVAMANLDRGGDGGHNHDLSAVLKFHPKAAATPFNHVDLGWNPHGHEPEPIYGLPHFDFHYYMITPEAVAAIPPYDVDPTGHNNVPAAEYLPPTYFNPGGGVPKMGVHWLDATSPELGGAKFGQTFIYGTFNGKVTFYEPMITEEFILNNPGFERSIPQPSKVQTSGYYPTKMRISKQNDITNIILEGFVYRQAS